MALDSAITYIPGQEIARIAVAALTEPRAVGQRIDLGMDRPASAYELSALFSSTLAKPVTPTKVPAGPMEDLASFFDSGNYVADTAVQQALFGPLLKLADELPRLLKAAEHPGVA
jgi:uncharacterized protein YbjT (DUF2867 family)